jgi:Reverse transcriptase (RNA-dependent DNA polymerase)
MDAAVREWLATQVDNASIVTHGFGHTIAFRLGLLYADDTLIGSRNAPWLQTALQSLVDIFARLGLEANASKTKTMMCLPALIRTGYSYAAFRRYHTGDAPSYRERQQMRMTCPVCGKELNQSSLTQHL